MEFQPGGTEEAARQQAMPIEQEETAALTDCQAQTDSRDPRSLCKAPNAYYLYPAGNRQMGNDIHVICNFYKVDCVPAVAPSTATCVYCIGAYRRILDFISSRSSWFINACFTKRKMLIEGPILNKAGDIVRKSLRFSDM